MGSRTLLTVATGEGRKALAGLIYARNALKYQRLDEVKAVSFGPSEKSAAGDMETRQLIEEIVARGDCFACQAISNKEGVSERSADA